MATIELRNMGARSLGLIALSVSLAVVLSSYVWWANVTTLSGGSMSIYSETHGFPFPFYSVFTPSLGIPLRDFEPVSLGVDTMLVFILCIAVLGFLRWRALNSRRRRP